MRRRYVMLLSFAFSLVIVIMAVCSYMMIDALLDENARLKAQLTAAQAAVEHGARDYSMENILVDVQKSYCNLIVDQWESNDDTLTIHTAYAQAVVASNVALTSAQNARLILRMGDEEVSTYDVILSIGESSECLEADLENITFQIPALTIRDELELWLEVTLPGNVTVIGYGASWYRQGGRLHLISG